MAADPEDPLARMHRWDALQRRLEPARPSDPPPPPDPTPVAALTELAALARQLLATHPGLVITITVQDQRSQSSVRIGDPEQDQPGQDDAPERDEPAPDGRPGNRAAAELAELLRQDPARLANRPHRAPGA